MTLATGTRYGAVLPTPLARPADSALTPRRSASARRSAGSSPTKSGTSRITLQRKRDERDGKTTVACPQCGAQYRVPAEQMDQQLHCKHCPRAFFPNAVGRRAPRSNNATPFIMGGAILVFMIAVAVIMSSGGGGETQTTNTGAAPKTLALGTSNPRVGDCGRWAAALAAADTFQLAGLTDGAAVGAKLGVARVDGSTLDQQNAVVAGLLASPETELIRQCKFDSGLVDKQWADASRGEVRLFLSLLPEHEDKYYRFPGQVEVAVKFVFENDRARVTDWDYIRKPTVKPPKGDVYIVHEQIGVAKDVEREFAGVKRTVREAELVPLPHVEGTPPEIQREVDDLVVKLVDIDAPGAQSNQAIRRLKAIGKPAVPRLLNQMVAIKLDSQDNVLRLRRIAMALEDLTGQRFGFNPALKQEVAAASDDESRMSALRQWYGWWADNHWRKDFDYAIDKEDTLEIKEDEAAKPNDPSSSRIFR